MDHAVKFQCTPEPITGQQLSMNIWSRKSVKADPAGYVIGLTNSGKTHAAPATISVRKYKG
jgi:hypothetical protein